MLKYYKDVRSLVRAQKFETFVRKEREHFKDMSGGPVRYRLGPPCDPLEPHPASLRPLL
jgi:hypothetical protein